MDVLFDEIGEAHRQGNAPLAKLLTAFAKSSNSAKGIQNALQMARSEKGIPVDISKLDTAPWLLNLENGTLELRESDLRPHNRDDLITKMAPVVFDESAECPDFRAFMNRILPKKDVRRFVQRAVGMSMVGEVTDQALLFCYGTGANGKSTFLNTVMAMLGEYAFQAPENMLLATNSDSTRSELAQLFKKRFVACIEAESGRRLAESLVKQLTGKDTITARKLFQDFFEFLPTHQIWMAANHKPTIRGQDDGIWRRIFLIPFTETIPAKERDTLLPDRLLREMSGILNWALFGLKQWQVEGLAPPKEVQDATREYRDSEDKLSEFFEAQCSISPNNYCLRSELLKAYQDWSEKTGQKTWSRSVFYRAIEERGFQLSIRDGYRRIDGISLVVKPGGEK